MQGVSQTRDLVGYGGTPPAWKLPGGAKLAVSMVVNFEEGAEFAVSDGDPQAEKISEVVSVVPPGKWDQGNEQIFAYGMRAGIWRMLAALEKYRRPVTFYMCGRAVERLPQIARRIVEAGHEAACHGWLWRPHADYSDRDAECMISGAVSRSWKAPRANVLRILLPRQREPRDTIYPAPSWASATPATASTMTCLIGTSRTRSARSWSCRTRSTATT